MSTADDWVKRLRWLKGEVKTPPFSHQARREAGLLMRRLQVGEMLGMPHSRPMPSIGPRCHELRVRDGAHNWRLIYRIDATSIVIVEVFAKTSRKTPQVVIDQCKSRLRRYDESDR
jgi:phage-related protein